MSRSAGNRIAGLIESSSGDIFVTSPTNTNNPVNYLGKDLATNNSEQQSTGNAANKDNEVSGTENKDCCDEKNLNSGKDVVHGTNAVKSQSVSRLIPTENPRTPESLKKQMSPARNTNLSSCFSIYFLQSNSNNFILYRWILTCCTAITQAWSRSIFLQFEA